MQSFVDKQVIVGDFVTLTKQWNIDMFINILLEQIINKIKAIPIPVTNMDDKIIWKITFNGEYLVQQRGYC